MRKLYLQMTVNGPESFVAWMLYLCLWPLGCLYGVITYLRACAYKTGLFGSYRATIPVISVGNITTGGTGKTPVVDALVKHLSSIGKNVAVVSRGYRGTYSGECARVSPDGQGTLTSAKEAGDEPFLLAVRNPDVDVFVARKRRHGVAAAEAAGVDCVVLDDGFQHLAVARDLDIVLLDGRAPFGNGSLLPAGNLRESRKALGRAGLLLLTHSDEGSVDIANASQPVTSRHRLADNLVDCEGGIFPWAAIRDKRCVAFAGIAHPEPFFQAIQDKGCQLVGSIPMVDHQEFNADVIRQINGHCKGADYLLTTEKDIVKLAGADFCVPCLAAPLEIEFDDFRIIADALEDVFGENDA